MVRLFMIFILFILSGMVSADPKDPLRCSRQLLDQTDGFLAYLSHVIQEHQLSMNDLKVFERELKKGKIVNPIALEKKQVEVALHEPYEEFNVYITETKLDLIRIKKWVSAELERQKKIQVERSKTVKETKSIYQKMVFHPIPRGEFMMGEVGKEKKVTLTHDIEMMSTKVTQKMWMELMGVNPSHFKLSPDHPVEKVTWWSVVEFANRLSIKNGFKPAYDLSGIEWKEGTSAEAGNLTPSNPKLANYFVTDNNKKIYDTEGYRLPTLAEAEYVRKNLGRSQGKFYFGSDEEELAWHAWFSKNSTQTTQPVATLKPLVIGTTEFFDLQGNTDEWCWDWMGDSPGGVDPVNIQSSLVSRRIIKGGDFNDTPELLESSHQTELDPTISFERLGFRLVRTLPVQKP